MNCDFKAYLGYCWSVLTNQSASVSSFFLWCPGRVWVTCCRSPCFLSLNVRLRSNPLSAESLTALTNSLFMMSAAVTHTVYRVMHLRPLRGLPQTLTTGLSGDLKPHCGTFPPTKQNKSPGDELNPDSSGQVQRFMVRLLWLGKCVLAILFLYLI